LRGLPGRLAAGETELQVLPQELINRAWLSALGQDLGLEDVPAGRWAVLVEGVEQKPLIQGKGILWEGRHHLIATGDGLFDLVHLQPPQAIFPIRFGLGEGLLRTTDKASRHQKQGKQQEGQA
jgi:hypothetical protein